MKKTDQNPIIKIVKIRTSQFVAASPGYGGTTDATSGNAARQFGGFIDDEEE